MHNKSTNAPGFQVNIAKIITFILFGLFSLKCISLAFTSTLSFDGAMNAQVAQNLAANFRYADSYNELTDFDPRIQTGLPVLLPAAFMIKIFGATSESVLMVNAFYLILLAFSMLYYLRNCVGVDDLFLIPGILFLYGTPQIFFMGMGLFGEIPALFYLMLVLIFLNKYDKDPNKKYLFLAGICLGLAILVKTVMLIAIPAILFAALFDVLVKKRMPIAQYIRDDVLMAIGAGLPLLSFEIFKLVSLGMAGYVAWWGSHISAIFAQAGVTEGFSDTPDGGGKFFVHLDLLASYVSLHPAVVAGILLVLLLLFLGILLAGIARLKSVEKEHGERRILFSNDFLVLLTVTLSYFGWWLIITPTAKAWYRRIINGTLLLELCVMIGAFLVIQFILSRKAKSRSARTKFLLPSIVVLISLLPGLNVLQDKNHWITFEPTSEKQALAEAGAYIRSLPPAAEFFGYDWWQAPGVAFESGKPFSNINRDLEMEDVGSKSEKYLVIDQAAEQSGSKGYADILSTYQNDLVFSRGGIAIYQLLYKLPYPEFTDEERARVDDQGIDFTTEDQGYCYRNVYFDEVNPLGKWAQRYSGFLLKSEGEDILRIEFRVYSIQSYNKFPFQVEISVNGQNQDVYTVDREGSHEIHIPLTQLSEGILEITLASDARVVAPGDERKLALFLKRMDLLDR